MGDVSDVAPAGPVSSDFGVPVGEIKLGKHMDLRVRLVRSPYTQKWVLSFQVFENDQPTRGRRGFSLLWRHSEDFQRIVAKGLAMLDEAVRKDLQDRRDHE